MHNKWKKKTHDEQVQQAAYQSPKFIRRSACNYWILWIDTGDRRLHDVNKSPGYQSCLSEYCVLQGMQNMIRYDLNWRNLESGTWLRVQVTYSLRTTLSSSTCSNKDLIRQPWSLQSTVTMLRHLSLKVHGCRMSSEQRNTTTLLIAIIISSKRRCWRDGGGQGSHIIGKFLQISSCFSPGIAPETTAAKCWRPTAQR